MVRHGGSSAGSYLTDPTFPIPSHCASIVMTNTLRVKFLHCIAEFKTALTSLRARYPQAYEEFVHHLTSHANVMVAKEDVILPDTTGTLPPGTVRVVVNTNHDELIGDLVNTLPHEDPRSFKEKDSDEVSSWHES